MPGPPQGHQRAPHAYQRDRNAPARRGSRRDQAASTDIIFGIWGHPFSAIWKRSLAVRLICDQGLRRERGHSCVLELSCVSQQG